MFYLLDLIKSISNNAKSNQTKNKVIEEKAIQSIISNYHMIMDVLDNIIAYYIAEDRILNPYGDDASSYINDKDIENIIKSVTEKIITELSDEVYRSLSHFIKPETINLYINRRVTIAVVDMVTTINSNNQAQLKANDRRSEDFNKILQSFNDQIT